MPATEHEQVPANEAPSNRIPAGVAPLHADVPAPKSRIYNEEKDACADDRATRPAAADVYAVASVDYDEPNWHLLEKVVDADSIGVFMYMGTAHATSGERIVLFKHGGTRRYLNLMLDANYLWAMRYVRPHHRDDVVRYAAVPLEDAVAHILGGYEGPAGESCSALRRRRQEALGAAGWRVATSPTRPTRHGSR